MPQPRRVAAGPSTVAAFVVALLATLLGASPASAASSDLTWSVKPTDGEHGTARPNFTYAVDPGDVIHDALDVSNFGPSPLTLAVYAADAFTTSSGQLDLLPAGEPSTDVGTWVALDTDEITVDPGQTVTVPFTVTVPADARPGDHSGGVVTSFVSTQDGTTVQLDRRLGSRMHLRVTGDLEPAVAVSDVRVVYHHSWNPFGTSDATVTYTVSNRGNTRVAASDAVSVAGLFGWARTSTRTEEAAELPELLPGDQLPRQVEITGVWPLFRASATVQLTAEGVGLGGEPLPLVTRTGGTWAVPWVLLVLVVLVVALASWGPGWWSRLVRRSAAGTATGPGAAVAPATAPGVVAPGAVAVGGVAAGGLAAVGTAPAEPGAPAIGPGLASTDRVALEAALAQAREEGRREALRALEAERAAATGPAPRGSEPGAEPLDSPGTEHAAWTQHAAWTEHAAGTERAEADTVGDAAAPEAEALGHPVAETETSEAGTEPDGATGPRPDADTGPGAQRS